MILQALREISGSQFVPCEALLASGMEATQIVRDGSAHAGAMYMSAALSAAFLRTPDGRTLLESADRAGLSLLQKARAHHGASEVGSLECYSWTLIRKLHPKGPAQLMLWGSEKHYPKDSPHRTLHARCACVSGIHIVLLHSVMASFRP